MTIPADRAEFTIAALRTFKQLDRREIAHEIDRQLAEGTGPDSWRSLLELLRRDVFAEEVNEAAVLARLHPDFGAGCWSP